MDFILPICDTCRKNKIGYCYVTCYSQKNPTFSQNYPPVAQDHHFKMMTQHSKNATFLKKNASSYEGILTILPSSKSITESTIGNMRISSCQ